MWIIILTVFFLIITVCSLFSLKRSVHNYFASYIDEMTFAIVMATFRRPNGKSPEYLERSIQSVINQIYTDWCLIIVGDKYEPEAELLQIIDKYRQDTTKIVYLRNVRSERDYVTHKPTLWNVGGANAMNVGLDYIRKSGYTYYAHLDDDDYWSQDHLSTLAEMYQKYPRCIFVNTQSKNMGGLLPNKRVGVYENNLIPQGCTMNHSSFSFRVDVIPFSYKSSQKGELVKEASDANMLNNIRQFLVKHKQYTCVYVPKLTCFHPEEGTMRN